APPPGPRGPVGPLPAPAPSAPAALAEVLDRLDPALAGLEDTQTALAELQFAAGATQPDRYHARRGMGLARWQLENARREATDALEWVEAVGRYGSRRRHPSGRRHA